MSQCTPPSTTIKGKNENQKNYSDKRENSQLPNDVTYARPSKAAKLRGCKEIKICHWWLMPIILTIHEAEIRRITV
jgi:hypothetical protein